ncbi:Methyltransferase domain-containing protein [Amycolatopsis arida]|uniref:Methyltransferase domain-containing protein n=1 Tax=Amycolatopsis arida TaxID=587909 RepID=A0A1I5S6M5_9PSEU|nr:methyltransferase domain-containing protein [Amycolatopsis arida]TDX85300.1 methyltransferase family protein [Amycolatopsis arida]SFP66344.1 Methyltransferase domain-containing protein [Amycolatopsis arida]
MQVGYPPDAAGFVLPVLRPGMLVLDVGCGSGTLTRVLGTAVYPVRVLGVDPAPERVVEATTAARRHRVSTVAYVVGEPGRLPLPDAAVDLVFGHALLDRSPEPAPVLAELARVLRPGGTLALSTSDWGRVRLRPRTANVDAALRGYFLLCRRSGQDPFAGRAAAERVEAVGFRDVRVRTRYKPGPDYRELAEEVEAALAAALGTSGGDHGQLASAARSAWLWARGGRGEVSQCWTELLATR